MKKWIKMQENVRKICKYKIIVVPLQRILLEKRTKFTKNALEKRTKCIKNKLEKRTKIAKYYA